MKLAQLLEKNQNSRASCGLAENFGDSYLCGHNQIFASIRTAVISAGFRLSCQYHPFYQALPLSQLEWILSNKQIPFCDNMGVLHAIENKVKNRILWDDICDQLTKNHLFHESCHGVARFIFNSQQPPRADHLATESQLNLMKVLLEESFANTCELLAIVDAADAAHRIFFEWNSYICMFNERGNLAKVMSELGEEKIFQLMLLCYLHSNFQYSKLEESQLQRVLDFVGFEKGLETTMKKLLRAISKIAFQLNPRFRQVTTSFYLKMNGTLTPMSELIDFDFMAVLESHPYWSQLLQQLTRTVFTR